MPEVIDVDYEVIAAKDDDSRDDGKGTEITVNADPYSAAISGLVSIANHITDSVTEYNLCKQQEKTKRDAIKARLRIELDRIDSQKEICLKLLDQQHEENMKLIEKNYQKFNDAMTMISDAIQSAVRVAEHTGDFSEVCRLIDKQCDVMRLLSDIEIRQMQARTEMIQLQNPVAGYLK